MYHQISLFPEQYESHTAKKLDNRTDERILDQQILQAKMQLYTNDIEFGIELTTFSRTIPPCILTNNKSPSMCNARVTHISHLQTNQPITTYTAANTSLPACRLPFTIKDLAIKIFQYLDAYTLLCCQRVSQQWFEDV